jgi:hypothetical protein
MMGSDMPFPIGDLAPLKIVAETSFSDASAPRSMAALRSACSAVRCDEENTA